MAEQQIALAATGIEGETAEGWGTRAVGAKNTVPWKTGRQVLDTLTGLCKSGADCIGTLYLFSHAWRYDKNGNRGGVASNGPEGSGFYLQKTAGDHADARDLSDLRSAIDRKEVRFCGSCKIVLTGCRVAASDFPEELVRMTGCTVIAARGSSRPTEAQKGVNLAGDYTGTWESAAETTKEAQEGGYLGWKEYKKENENITVRELGPKIRIWGKKIGKFTIRRLFKSVFFAVAITMTLGIVLSIFSRSGIRQCIGSALHPGRVQSCNVAPGPNVPTFINNDYLGPCEDASCPVIERGVYCDQRAEDGTLHSC